MTASETTGSEERARMVDRDLRSRGVTDRAVLSAMATVPRERFVAEALAEFAYEDAPLPIAEGQTISQPLIVAAMAQAAEIGPDDRVLEVGAGSGYGAAVLGRLAAEVWSVERLAVLAGEAARRIRELGYRNVHVVEGDGTLGWPEAAPFDAIVVTAGGPAVPAALVDQLVEGGRLVIPVGSESQGQELLRVRKVEGEAVVEDLGPVRFVPLVGEQGWSEGSSTPPSARASRPSWAGLLALVVVAVVLAVTACVPPAATTTSTWAEVCTPTDAYWDRIDVSFVDVPVGSWLGYARLSVSSDESDDLLLQFSSPQVGQTVSVVPARRGRCIHLQPFRGLTYRITPVVSSNPLAVLVVDPTRDGYPAGEAGPYLPWWYLGMPPTDDVAGVTDATAVDVGAWSTCAVAAGSVRCWGLNSSGELGDGTYVDRSTPAPVSGLSGVVQVAVGYRYACALKSDGTVWCWGDNADGTLGDGTFDDSPTPVQVQGVSGAEQLVADLGHACAVIAGGSISCWGDDRLGIFGNGGPTPGTWHPTAIGATDLTGVVDLATDQHHSCAVVGAGGVACWGRGNDGQLGDGAAVNRAVPVAVPGVSDATRVATGELHSCALRTSGSATCWGRAAAGQLGNGATPYLEPSPVAVADLSGAIDLDAGGWSTCALLGNGHVRCWGRGSSTAGFDVGALPVEVPTIVDATQVAVGLGHTCALRAGGTVRCWGGNQFGQLGYPAT